MEDADTLNNMQFVIGELLTPILHHSLTEDLIRFRAVSKTWRHECDRILSQRKDLEIPLTYCIHSYQMGFVRHCEFGDAKCQSESGFRCSVENFRVNPGRKTLPQLNDLLRDILKTRGESSPFFICRFRFELFYGYFESAEFYTFLQLHGKYIRGLSVENYDTYYVGQGGWTTSILRYTPNLDTLILRAKVTEKIFPDLTELERTRYEHFNRINPQINLERKSNDNDGLLPVDDFPYLHKLKTLEIQEHTSFFSQSTDLILPSFLVLSNPLYGQLKKVYFSNGFYMKTLSLFVPQQMKLLSIQKLHLKLISEGKVRNKHLLKLLTLNSVGLEVVHLVLYQSPENLDEWEFIFQVVQKIFLLNQNSIKEVHLQGAAVHLLRNIEGLPCLPFVEKLIVSMEFNNMESSFEQFDGFSSENGDVLARIFPNVKSFDFITHGNITQNEMSSPSVKWFPFWETKLSSVQDFRISTSCTNKSYCINKIPEMFPQAKTLKMSFTSDEFKENAKYLWEMKELESLNVEIFIKGDPFQNKKYEKKHFLDFDSAITGYSEDQITEILRISKETKSWPSKFDHLKRSASILNLKNLRRLDIKFVLPFLSNYPLYQVLSGVTGKFAFSLMKELQVNIQVCNTKSKQPIVDLFSTVTCFPNVKLLF